jgi:hypothetical protein
VVGRLFDRPTPDRILIKLSATAPIRRPQDEIPSDLTRKAMNFDGEIPSRHRFVLQQSTSTAVASNGWTRREQRTIVLPPLKDMNALIQGSVLHPTSHIEIITFP